MRITVKITGRLYDATSESSPELDLPPEATVDDALALLGGAAGAGNPILPQAMLAVSGEHLGTVLDHTPRTLVEGDEVLIFSPVAGG
ncbi:MAG: MoaD/ThiS family protein [Planctomycetaceae bacterium]|nr:MoaD/ThiS family protein [Planctomycetaceae bacterium]MBV8382351.1 MoaD/ThiS family protein [Planctomycetaceae bacterium]MBV8557829.1 MoaD/ThiS family protein [Planctomycetaceae bacterium]